MEFSREEVIEQLKKLGHLNVPDDVVEEFMEELRVDPVVNQERSNKQRNEVNEKSNNESNSKFYQTNEHLHNDYNFGEPRNDSRRYDIYDPSNEEIIQRNSQKYEKPLMIDDVSSYHPPELKPTVKRPKQHIRERNTSRKNLSNVRNKNKEREIINVYKRPRTANPRMKSSTVLNISPGKRKIRLRQRQKYRNKSDPVSRYHQFNNLWASDKFLSRNKDGSRKLRYQVRQELLEFSRPNY